MTTDILEAIDAATQQRCACGCGRDLPADGLSAWFAGQDCQHQWHQQQATDPEDVYDRNDCDGYDAPAPVRTPSPSGRLRYQPPPTRPVSRPPHPVSAEVRVTMSDGTRATYTFPNGVNPEINFDMNSDLDDDDPYGRFTGMRRFVTVNQRVTMTITAEQGRNTRTDGTLFTMTVPNDSTPA